MSLILCIMCFVLYAVVILFGYFQKKKVEEHSKKIIIKNMSAGEVAHTILKHHGLVTELDMDEDDEQEENDEDEEVEVVEDRPRFKFESLDAGQNGEEVVVQTTVSDTKDFAGVRRIKDDTNVCDIHYGDDVIEMSSDLYDSKTFSAISKAAYTASKFVIEHNKPFKYQLISIFTFIPKLIVQIGWLLCAAQIFGLLIFNDFIFSIIASVIIGSIMVSLLNILYPKHIAENAMQDLILLGIIQENEVTTAFNAINCLAEAEVTSCFGLLKFFLRNLMGYKI